MLAARLLILSMALLISSVAHSQGNTTRVEDQQNTCQMILGQAPAASECRAVFSSSAPCCMQYNAEELARQCAQMSSISFALTCFTEIHEVGFWKTELTGETEPGLGAQFAEQWKSNTMNVCASEGSNEAAIQCAILQKSGIRFVFNERNTQNAREIVESDPVMTFCREAFGEYWAGVEHCVEEQRAARTRLGF